MRIKIEDLDPRVHKTPRGYVDDPEAERRRRTGNLRQRRVEGTKLPEVGAGPGRARTEYENASRS